MGPGRAVGPEPVGSAAGRGPTSAARRPRRCPSYLQLRGSQGLVQSQELCFSPSSLKSLQQDAGPDLGEGQAPVHLSKAALNVLPHVEQLLFRQGEG